MKRFLLALILFFFLAGFAYAGPIDATDRLTADKLIRTGKAVVYGVLVETNGTANATLIIYDNTSGSGKNPIKIIVPGANYYGGITFPPGFLMHTGIYADITGTGAAFWVYWSKR